MSRNREIVERFYRAIQEKDAATIDQVIDQHFAPDAEVTLPKSLPYGGRVSGPAVKKMFQTLVRTRTPYVEPTRIVVDGMIEDANRIAVEVTFEWNPLDPALAIPMSAVEILTFEDDRIVSMRVIYQDTAACLKVLERQAASVG